MSKKQDPYASEEETLALIRNDTRSEAEKRLDKMLDERGASEQGAEPGIILRNIALELLEPQQEPFGYFKAEPFGWTDCAETDEGAIALYERPLASKPLTETEIRTLRRDLAGTLDVQYVTFARAIEAKLKERNQ